MAGAEAMVMAAALVFCRLGGCFMLAPGLGSVRIPVLARLWAAASVAAFLTPLLWRELEPALADGEVSMAGLIAGELIKGVALGFAARCFILALQFAATLAANAIGLAGVPGMPMEDSDPLAPLSSMVSLAAALLFMAWGLHIDFLAAIVASYDAMPVAEFGDFGWFSSRLVDVVASTSVLAVRMAAPLVLYALAVNIALGLIGRFAPQLQVYFASTGAILVGGLFVLYFVVPDWLLMAASAYSEWIREGRY